MISQPMAGRTEEEILSTKKWAEEIVKSLGYEIVNTYFEDFNEDEQENIPLFYLAKSLEAMTHCDAIFFCPDWQSARGCMIEMMAASAYGLTILSK